MKKTLSVVPRFEGGWGICNGSEIRPKGIYHTQKAAISHASSLCKEAHTELVIHRRNGTVREIHRFGIASPCPKK
jgi:hypothetical protein